MFYFCQKVQIQQTKYPMSITQIFQKKQYRSPCFGRWVNAINSNIFCMHLVAWQLLFKDFALAYCCICEYCVQFWASLQEGHRGPGMRSTENHHWSQLSSGHVPAAVHMVLGVMDDAGLPVILVLYVVPCLNFYLSKSVISWECHYWEEAKHQCLLSEGWWYAVHSQE